MTAKRAGYVTGAYKAYFHDLTPLFTELANELAIQVTAAIEREMEHGGRSSQPYTHPEWIGKRCWNRVLSTTRKASLAHGCLRLRPRCSYVTNMRASAVPILAEPIMAYFMKISS